MKEAQKEERDQQNLKLFFDSQQSIQWFLDKQAHQPNLYLFIFPSSVVYNFVMRTCSIEIWERNHLFLVIVSPCLRIQNKEKGEKNIAKYSVSPEQLSTDTALCIWQMESEDRRADQDLKSVWSLTCPICIMRGVH